MTERHKKNALVADETVENLNDIVKRMAASYVSIMVALVDADIISAEQLAASLARATCEVERAVVEQGAIRKES